jgi:hypothetical protein
MVLRGSPGCVKRDLAATIFRVSSLASYGVLHSLAIMLGQMNPEQIAIEAHSLRISPEQLNELFQWK